MISTTWNIPNFFKLDWYLNSLRLNRLDLRLDRLDLGFNRLRSHLLIKHSERCDRG